MRKSRYFLSIVSFASLMAVGAAADRKQLIPNRGAPGSAPEHTAAAYRLAMDQYADFVEPDLAVTKDNVLICLHDDSLARTTNVAEVFPDRASGLANNFTIAKINRLGAARSFAPKSAGQQIQTFQDAISPVRGKAGLYPE